MNVLRAFQFEIGHLAFDDSWIASVITLGQAMPRNVMQQPLIQARQLLWSIQRYMASSAFNPSQELEPRLIRSIV